MKKEFRKVLMLVCAVALMLSAAAAMAEEGQAGAPGFPDLREYVTHYLDNYQKTDSEESGATAETAVTPAPQESAAEEASTLTDTPADKKNENNNESPTWLSKLVERLGKTHVEAWIALGTIIALFIVMRIAIGSAKKWNARMISYGALSIALSFVLSYIRLYEMPTGGSITPGSMLPIMLFAATYGVAPGVLAGLTYGILQFLQKPEFINVWQFILDYLLAFSALGLAGFAFRIRKKGGLYISITIAAVTRAICAILAGIMWAIYYVNLGYELEAAGTKYTSTLLYSIVYNGIYMVPEVIICVVLAFFIAKPVMRVMKTK